MHFNFCKDSAVVCAIHMLMVQGGAEESSGEIPIYIVLPAFSKDREQGSWKGGVRGGAGMCSERAPCPL